MTQRLAISKSVSRVFKLASDKRIVDLKKNYTETEF